MSTSFKTPVQLVQNWVEKQGESIFLRQPKQRKLVDFSWQEVYDTARRVSAGLQALGLEKGDRVAILSKNCAEWIITDLAIMMGGFISIPIYPTANRDTIEYVLKHSQSKAVFIGKLDPNPGQEEGIDGSILRIDMSYDTLPCQFTWQGLQQMAEPVEPLIADADDVISIIYTSGSTGNPKGAVLTYASYHWAGRKIKEMASEQSYARCLSYLPLAHITERCYVEGAAFETGGQLYFVESLDSFIDDVKVAAPTFFISVPRLWSLFQQNIFDKLGRERLNLLLRIPLLSSLIKKKIVAGLGLQHAHILGCGSAPVAPSLIQWYRTIGMNISEAWGMTENCAYATSNYPFNADKIGTVGKLLDGCEGKLSDEGEFLFKSPGLFREYYLDPENTQASFTEDGYFRTGDLASVDDQGYVSIIGRLKDNFKTAKGKFVSPVAIERRLAQDPYIELLCVIGSGLPGPVALIQLSEGAQILDKKQIEASLEQTINTTNDHVESHARIKTAIIVTDTWTPESGILTPTLKIKRHELERRYNEMLQEKQLSGIVWEKNIQ